MSIKTTWNEIIPEDLKVWVPPKNSEKIHSYLRYAAAVGNNEAVVALLNAGAKPNDRDLFGWNSLHWAAANHNIHTLIILKHYGGDIFAVDPLGTTPIDILVIDFEMTSENSDKKDLVTWGDSSNYALGHEGKNQKEITNIRKVDGLKNFEVISVGLSQYHTACVNTNGDLITWGFGGYGTQNLRLGYPSEVQIEPKKVALSGKALKVAVSPNHTAIIITGGKLLTFGKGSCGQLGHGDKNDVPTPKTVAALKSMNIQDVQVSPTHTCVLTNKGTIYAFGEGTWGQLGNSTYETELVPRIVPLEDVVQIAVCEKATLVTTQDMETYWFGMKLTNAHPVRLRWQNFINQSMGFKIKQICCTTKVFYFLAEATYSERALYYFTPGKDKSIRKLNILEEFSVAKKSCKKIIQIVTNEANAFALNKAHQIYTWPLANPTKAVRIYTDIFHLTKLFPGSHHMAGIRNDIEYPQQDFSKVVSKSTYIEDFKRLLYKKEFSDTTIKLGNDGAPQIFAHSFFLSRSGILRDLIINQRNKERELNEMLLINISSLDLDAFKIYLRYLYTDELLSDTDDISIKNNKHPLYQKLLDIATQYGPQNLVKLMKSQKDLDSQQTLKNFASHFINANNKLSKNLGSDVKFIVGRNKEELYAHSSILVCRSHYFNMMLNTEFSSWKEATDKEIEIPDINFATMKALLYYLYTDQCLFDSQIMSEVCLLADRFLLRRLCELASGLIANHISLSNAVGNLELARIVNSQTLSQAVLEFLSRNIDRALCMSILNNCDKDMLDDINVMVQLIHSNKKLNFLDNDKKVVVEDFLKALKTEKVTKSPATIPKISKNISEIVEPTKNISEEEPQFQMDGVDDTIFEKPKIEVQSKETSDEETGKTQLITPPSSLPNSLSHSLEIPPSLEIEKSTQEIPKNNTQNKTSAKSPNNNKITQAQPIESPNNKTPKLKNPWGNSPSSNPSSPSITEILKEEKQKELLLKKQQAIQAKEQEKKFKEQEKVAKEVTKKEKNGSISTKNPTENLGYKFKSNSRKSKFSVTR